jgi:ubiquinone/menaquinone biosynthesis C-methylase UbiE
MPGAHERSGYLPALRFKALTPLFDSVVRATTRESTFKRALIDAAGPEPGQRVLDLGCGTGTLAMMIKREAEAEVTGLDADSQILELARRKAADAGLGIKFDEGLADELPYADGSFDRVLSTLFFHHLTGGDKRACLAEVRRVLRPDGQLHVADWTAPADPVQALLSWQIRLFDGVDRTRENFTGQLAAVVAAAGFAEVREGPRIRTALGTLGLLSAKGSVATTGTATAASGRPPKRPGPCSSP